MTPALAHDAAVPQRDLLLDPRFVAGRLETLLGLCGPVPIEDCAQTRVKYRIGARLRVVHRIRVEGTTYDVAASTFRTLGRSERAYAEGLASAVPCGPLLPVAHDPELRTVFWSFPNDRKLGHLAALAAPARGLAELVPGWNESTLVAYAPEKTATVRCLNAAGKTLAYAKTYSSEEEDGERTRSVHEALRLALGEDDPYLRVPRALGYSPEHRTLAVKAIEGTQLFSSDGADPYLGLRYRQLGRALARLHGLAPIDVPRFHRVDADRLDQAAGLIASVRRDMAAPARALARELARRAEPEEGDVCLHGDVNFRNALREGGRVALIDLDQAARGPAAADVGSVLASLHYAGTVGLLPAAVAPTLREAFLAGYSELRRLPAAAALRWHTVAALLAERALRVVTRIRPEGLARLPALLAEARRVLV